MTRKIEDILHREAHPLIHEARDLRFELEVEIHRLNELRGQCDTLRRNIETTQHQPWNYRNPDGTMMERDQITEIRIAYQILSKSAESLGQMFRAMAAPGSLQE